jgi:hypothetical protein
MDPVSKLLPGSSLVPLAIRRVPETTLVWANDGLPLDRSYDDYAYISVESGGEPGLTEIAYAERYGGKGVGANGGGARCGLFRGVQIKGIGRNSLLGKGSDRAHSSGELTMKEALKEAIWGEVYHVALPYGAARGYAVLDTGMQTQWRDPALEDGDSPRALLLRQAIIRPAHYMRAIGFSTEGKAMVSDRERTSAAINRLIVALGASLELPPDGNATLSAYLAEMVRRFGQQLAASIVRRLPHGSVNCSNIGIDGRYIDFYHATHISDFGRIITYRAAPELFDTYKTLHPTIHNLCFYLNKYVEDEDYLEISGAELWKVYKQGVDSAFQSEFLLLTGLSHAAVAEVPADLARDFSGCVTRIVSAGNREPFCYPQMPYQMGHYRLSSLLGRTAFACDSESIGMEMENLMGRSRLTQDFVEVLSRLRRFSAAGRSSEDPESFRTAVRCMARNSDLPELHRFNLEARLPGLYRETPAVVGAFIGTILRKVKAIHSEEDEFDLAWCRDDGARLGFAGGVIRLNDQPIAAGRLQQELSLPGAISDRELCK